MARSRNIKPGFFKNEDLGTADPFVSLLFAGLWTLADKEGILEDRPLRIKAELFPYRENFDINGYLTVLVAFNMVVRYSVDGKGYIQIVEFKKHQNPHHTEKDSEYPSYTDGCQITVKQPLNNGHTPADSLIPDSLIPDSLIHDSLIVGDEKKERVALATRLPDNWTPSDEDYKFCKTKRPDLEIIEVVEQFKDYWMAIPGAKGRKLNWSATWRNWVRNQRKGKTLSDSKKFDPLEYVNGGKGDQNAIDGTAERLS